MSSEEEVSSQQLNGGRKPIKKGKKGTSKVHKMISSTYQKQKCDFYNRGSCNKGSHCTFSHSFVPDVAKVICCQSRKYANSSSATLVPKAQDAPTLIILKDIPANSFTSKTAACRPKSVGFLTTRQTKNFSNNF